MACMMNYFACTQLGALGVILFRFYYQRRVFLIASAFPLYSGILFVAPSTYIVQLLGRLLIREMVTLEMQQNSTSQSPQS